MAPDQRIKQCLEVFPAHAGMNGTANGWTSIAQCISRARRDDWSEEKQAESLAKYFPRTPGWLALEYLKAYASRVFPAYAGMIGRY